MNGFFEGPGGERDGRLDDLEAQKEQMMREDPKYRDRVERVERERRQRAEELRIAEEPIVADLRGAGVEVESVWDLVNTAESYPDALSVLMMHFERGDYPDRVMEGIGRALAVKPAVDYWGQLKKCYANARGPGEREGAAIALSVCAQEENLNELIELLEQDSLGDSRLYLLRAVKRLGGAEGRRVLEELFESGVFVDEIGSLLRMGRARGE